MPDSALGNLNEIFHVAVAQPAHERAPYLDRICDGNGSLRESVESHEETVNFMDAPAYEAAAEMLANEIEDKSGETIAHYRIRSLLGAVGMGSFRLGVVNLYQGLTTSRWSMRCSTNPRTQLSGYRQRRMMVSAVIGS